MGWVLFQTLHIAVYLVLKPTEVDITATIVKTRKLNMVVTNTPKAIEMFGESRGFEPGDYRIWALC